MSGRLALCIIGQRPREGLRDPVIVEHTVWSDHVTHTTEDCACVCVVCVPYAVART